MVRSIRIALRNRDLQGKTRVVRRTTKARQHALGRQSHWMR